MNNSLNTIISVETIMSSTELLKNCSLKKCQCSKQVSGDHEGQQGTWLLQLRHIQGHTDKQWLGVRTATACAGWLWALLEGSESTFQFCRPHSLSRVPFLAVCMATEATKWARCVPMSFIYKCWNLNFLFFAHALKHNPFFDFPQSFKTVKTTLVYRLT